MARKSIKMKPGKGQSSLGFGVGIIFCLIGLVVVIPVFGAFGILWTLVAVGITVSHGMNVFSDKGMPTHEIVIEEEEDGMEQDGRGRNDGAEYYWDNETNGSGNGDGQSRESREKGDTRERLEEAKRLYDLELITEEEYTQKRKQILEDL